ncbi:LacI family DNA-binding transcriptional regulator [Georgenia sp. AZ-5]|uniref:LacI family DNA-binding transcriptional regulator n=1 Tax=Georgenia sp. AZ-5 TaxID=3367526 RepID=UPI0037550218
MTRARIKEVAELAGVSPSTVSVVLNDVPGARVKTATRERVQAAARELGYLPNGLARGLRTRRSGILALISDVIATTPYAGQLIQGAQEAAWEAGYLLMLVDTGGDSELERSAIRALRQQQVAGVLYATMYHRHVEVPELLTGLPVVLLDARPARGYVPAVVPDEEAGARTAVAALADHGHRRIGFVLDRNDGPAVTGRLAGYRAELDARGLPRDDTLVVRATSSSAGGREAVAALLDLPQPPTAVFAFNDEMAVGAYHAAEDRGLRIPRDLSVVGFDDLYVVAREMRPGLTTVALPHRAMGAVAARSLLRLVSDPAAAVPPLQLVDCPLVRRGSVAEAPTAVPAQA